MRQVRMVVCMLVLGALLSFTPSGSAQTLTYVTIDPVGAGDVWAAGISSTAATASCGDENASNDEGQKPPKKQQEGEHQQAQAQQQGENQGDHQDEGQVGCNDEGAGSPPPSSGALKIVGYYNLGPSVGNSYVWSGTTATPLAVPGATATFARGVNGAGHVVGDYQDALGNHGFLMVGANVTKIDVAGAQSTTCTGINASDQIVGYYYDAMWMPHGFLYSAGTFKTIDYPGVWGTYGAGINNLGQIVGYTLSFTGRYQAVVWAGASSAPQILVTGAPEAKAYGINASGEIVGGLYDATGVHGFRLVSGRVTVVNIPGAASTVVNAINDSGAISGEYRLNLTPRQLGFKMP